MTAIADISDLYQEFSLHCSGVPLPVAVTHLRNALRRACEHSHIWRETLKFTILGDCAEILGCDESAEIVEIIDAWFDGRRLETQTPDWMNERKPAWRDTISGNPAYLVMERPRTIVLFPFQPGELEFYAAMKPSRTADTVPAALIDEYGEQIAEGAAAAALMMPEKAWTNMDNGALAAAKFNYFLDITKSREATTRAGGRIRTVAQFF